MNTAVDAAGRVVIPKDPRERLGIRRGRPLEIRERDGRIEIEPTPTAMTLAARPRWGGGGAGEEAPAAHGRPRARHARAHTPVMVAVDTSVVVAAFASWHEGHAGGRLLTRDRPAAPTYERLGVEFELLGLLVP